MNTDRHLPPVEWVKRVNGSWLVRGGLEQAAAMWLDHLQASDPPRLEAACLAARTMCGIRPQLTDPKPWFYSGLFSVATAEEAAGFIADHRITMATVPAMWQDPTTVNWLGGVGPETWQLIHDLRDAIARLGHFNPDG